MPGDLTLPNVTSHKKKTNIQTVLQLYRYKVAIQFVCYECLRFASVLSYVEYTRFSGFNRVYVAYRSNHFRINIQPLTLSNNVAFYWLNNFQNQLRLYNL